MPGANYMGGRRNAAKARARDADGRLEKNHFGRQRLAILGKGLGKTLAPDRMSRFRDLGPSGNISLAHARKSLEDTTGDLHTASRYDSPAYSRLRASPPRKRQKLERQSSNTHSRGSSLLMELDLSEPLSKKAAIARLLDQPDFAGLSQMSSTARQGGRQREISPDLALSGVDTMSFHRTSAATSDGYSASRSCSPHRGSKTSSSGMDDDAYAASGTAGFMPRIRKMQDRYEEWEEDAEFEAVSFDDDDDDEILSTDARDDSGFAERLEYQPHFVPPDLYSHARSSTSSSSLHRSSIPCHDIPHYENSSSDSVDPASERSLPWNQSARGRSLDDPATSAGGSRTDVSEQQSLSSAQLSRSEAPSVVEHSLRSHRSLDHLLPEGGFWDREAQDTSKLESSRDGSTPPSQLFHHSVDEEMLGDVVSGRLFEDADPLLAIRARLGLDTPRTLPSSDLAQKNVLGSLSSDHALPEDDAIEDDAIAAASVVEVLTRALEAPQLTSRLDTGYSYDLADLPRAPFDDEDINSEPATGVALEEEDTSLDTLLANYFLLDDPIPPSAWTVEPRLQSPSPVISAAVFACHVDPSPPSSLEPLVAAHHHKEPANPPPQTADDLAAPSCAESTPEPMEDVDKALGHEAPAQDKAIEAESCIVGPAPAKIIVGPTLFADDDGSDE